MKFKKGDKIEVFNKREDPAGSWWCAEIINGNTHNYYVKYDRDIPGAVSSLERVSRREIRPCPPSVKSRLDWMPGDIVEVLDNFSWKLAKIVMFSGAECFSIKLLGSSTKCTVPSSSIRQRHCWQDKDNKWVILRKDSAKCFTKATNGLSNEKLISKASKLFNDRFQAKRNISFVDATHILTTNANKRARTSSQPLKTVTGILRKMLPVEKVDTVASPRTMLGEKYRHSSSSRTFETNQGVGMANVGNRHCSKFMLDSSDAESVSSSVGSCSIIKSPHRSTCFLLNGSDQYTDLHHAPSEASVILGREASIPTNEALSQGIHNLELHAYRCTLSALYASGPISWEQEALLTNLRLMLHISIDEHLMELKNLVSALTNDYVR